VPCILKFICHFGFFVFIFLQVSIAGAQDLETLVKSPLLQAGGGLQCNQIFYGSNAESRQRKPYSYQFQGNLNFKILGVIDAPFLFYFSNTGNAFTQPTFNQTSFHPKYKWVETHFGKISCTWSPYTLNGHLFQGAAVDIKPSNWRISLAYGKFLSQTALNANSGNHGTAGYDRKGYGLQVQHKISKLGMLGFSGFAARDFANELQILTTPAISNLAFSIKTEMRLSKKLQWKIEVGKSWLTETQLLSEIPSRREFVFIPQINSNTIQRNAWKSHLEYSGKKGKYQFGYERVDPDYRSLGAYYFNNDLENITLGIGRAFLKNRIRFQGTVGRQRDKISAESGRMTRNVCNLQMQVHVSQKCQMQLGWSNFLSFTNSRTIQESWNFWNTNSIMDTTAFRQISKNITLGLNLQLRSDSQLRSGLMCNANLQQSAETGNIGNLHSSQFFNGMIGYNRQQIKKGNSIQLTAAISRSSNGLSAMWNLSPLLQYGYRFPNKKIQLSLGILCAAVSADFKYFQAQWNLRNQWSYAISKEQKLTFSYTMQMRNTSQTAGTASVFHQTAMLGYAVAGKFF